MKQLQSVFWYGVLACALAACSGGGSSPAPQRTNATPTPAGSTPTPAPSGGSATPTPHGATPTPTPTPAATATPAGPTPTPIVTATPGPPEATTGPALSYDPTLSRHAISPDIYGVTIFWSSSTPADLKTFATAIGLPANRYGGDATTRYNWNYDSSNAGSDFYFVAGNGESSVVPGASVDAIVDQNRALGTKSIITVPIIDYINNSAAYHCSYPDPPVSGQTGYDPYLTLSGGVKCGSGSNSSGYITDSNPLATDVANEPSIQQAWVTHFVSKYGPAGVPIYELDNEPNGWIAVHHDVRPQNIGYHELFNKSLAYAQAIKAADPTALVLGPGDIAPADENCNGGGVAGTCSGYGTTAPDGAAQNGNTPLGLWYLQQFAAQPGHYLDYYSMHYPGSCCFSTNGTLADMVTAIQRHQGWLASAFPSATSRPKLAYDEWNRGTGSGYSNALATADGLGVFGVQGVDLASFWGLSDATYPSAFAFLMYRNYDGSGGQFGDTSVSAASADTSKLTIYGAQRTADSAATILVVNETNGSLTSDLTFAHFTNVQPVLVYQYTSANPAAIVKASSLSTSGPNLYVTFPAQSLTMLVMPSGSTPLVHGKRVAPASRR